MAKIPVLALVPPVAFVALAGLFLGGMFRDDPEALPSVMIGREAPDISLDALPPLAEFSAEALTTDGVKLVNFWASWCAPCRVEHPHLMALADEGIPVYGINYKDEDAKALAFLEELGDPYTGVGSDKGGRTALDWGVYGVPETYVIGADGTVLLRIAGPVTTEVLARRLRPAIASAEQPNQE